jgi:hypothetical protein
LPLAVPAKEKVGLNIDRFVGKGAWARGVGAKKKREFFLFFKKATKKTEKKAAKK